MISRETVEEVLLRTDIQTLIGGFIPLKRAGSNLKGLCPFHNEKTPSFCVNADQQYYHCFGCGVSGNVINFVMEMESLSFYEAVKFLAEKAGMEMPEMHLDPDYKKKKEKKEVLLGTSFLIIDKKQLLHKLLHQATRQHRHPNSRPFHHTLHRSIHQRQIRTTRVHHKNGHMSRDIAN